MTALDRIGLLAGVLALAWAAAPARAQSGERAAEPQVLAQVNPDEEQRKRQKWQGQQQQQQQQQQQPRQQSIPQQRIPQQRQELKQERKTFQQERQQELKQFKQERQEDRKAFQKEFREERKDTVQDRKQFKQDQREQFKTFKEQHPGDQKALKEYKQDQREDRKAFQKEFREERKDAREERKEFKEQQREERKEFKQERREDRADFRAKRLDDLKQLRRQRVEEGGRRTVIEEPDRRLIVREGNRSIIRHDENERFQKRFGDARTVPGKDGTRVITFRKPDGSEVITVVDTRGRLIHRYRRLRNGRVIVLIDNRRFWRPAAVVGGVVLGGLILGSILDLPPPVVRIPRDRYIVEYDDASYEDVYEALSAPPVDVVERGYSLDEVLYNRYLRERMRRVDLDSINFEFGSWEVTPDQYPKLERIAQAMNRLIERNPEEMFLIEGHTDAVGSDEDNLTLADRRAEAVAMVLSEEFGVPPENLTTQGYGEQFLKVETDGPERRNRRVAVRRITPLLSRSEQ